MIFHVDIQLYQHNLLKDCLCFIVFSLLLCQSSVDCTYVGLLLGCLFCSTDVFVYTIRFSVQFSCSVMSDPLRPHEPQHARPPCPPPTPRVHPNPCPLSRWGHPTVSSSVVPFSSLNLFQHRYLFPVSLLFTSGGQSIGVSASTWVLPMNTQDWSPLGWTGWISLQSNGFSRVFSNTTVQKHQFFSAQFSL